MRFPRRALLTIAAALALVAAGQASLAADASVVASASDGSAAVRNNIMIDRPAGTLPGHVMVASIVSSDDDPGFNAPAGWNLVRQDSMKDMLRQAVYVKVAGSAEPASYRWDVPPGRRLAGGITTFGGVDPAHPIDAVNGTTGNGTAVSAPGVTTTVANTLLVHLAAVASDGTLTAPAGMTEGWEAAAPGASTRKNTKGAVASLSHALQPAIGPTGNRTGTVSGAGGRSIGVLLALRPIPAPDTDPPNTTITSGPSGTTTNAFATFTFTATEPSTFLCQLDGASAAEPCTSPKTYVNLLPGNHTFAVWATDTLGNADPSPATRSWTRSPDSGDPVMVGAGDIAYCGNDNDAATAQLLDHMPGTVVTLGDNVYDGGTLSEFSNCYGPTWGRHKARTTPVAGNHDYVTSSATGYFSYFGAAAGDPSEGYYDYTLGAWHVVVLNSNCAAIGGCGVGSPQEVWLRSVLAQSPAKCTVALWHHPRFSSGSVHGSNTATQAFWQALYDYGADVVLNGHEHFYERFGMQAPDGKADAVYGLRQITVGTGGRSSYGFNSTPAPNSDVRGRPYGVLKMILHDESYSWEFTPVTGQTFTDFGSSSCHGAPDTPPELPPPPPPPPPGGGIGVVGSMSDESSTSRTSIALSRPAGTAVGDVLVASVATNGDATIVASTPGWTVVRDDLLDGVVRQAVYVRVVGSTDPSSYQWTIPEGTRRITGGITAYSGVDTAQPVDAIGVRMNASGTAVEAPSITTTMANTMLVQVVALNAEGSLTPPAGMTEVWEADSPNTNAGNTRDVLSSSSVALQAAAGPTGNRVATASLPGASIGVLLSLRPAG